MKRSYNDKEEETIHDFKKKKRELGYMKDRETLVFELCFRQPPRFLRQFGFLYFFDVSEDIYNYHGLFVVLGDLGWHKNPTLKYLYNKKNYKKLYANRKDIGASCCANGICIHSGDYSYNVHYFAMMGLKKLVLNICIRYNTCKVSAIKLLELV